MTTKTRGHRIRERLQLMNRRLASVGIEPCITLTQAIKRWEAYAFSQKAQARAEEDKHTSSQNAKRMPAKILEGGTPQGNIVPALSPYEKRKQEKAKRAQRRAQARKAKAERDKRRQANKELK